MLASARQPFPQRPALLSFSNQRTGPNPGEEGGGQHLMEASDKGMGGGAHQRQGQAEASSALLPDAQRYGEAGGRGSAGAWSSPSFAS